MTQNMSNLLRIAIEHSEGTPASVTNPEDAAWLREALSSMSHDPVKQLKNDINGLTTLLSSSDEHKSEVGNMMEDLLCLTEDLDLANDFFKLGGTDLLLRMLFNGPSIVKSGALQLLANLTQNNPEAQMCCHSKDILPRLLLTIEEENDVEYLTKLILGISCLTRSYPPAVSVFKDSNGFEILLNAMIRIKNCVHSDTTEQTKRLLAKGAFLMFSLLQDVAVDSLSSSDRDLMVEKLLILAMSAPPTEEHLLASLIMLFSETSTLEEATEKLNSGNCPPCVVPSKLFQSSVSWLRDRSMELEKLNDPAHTELKTYVDVLLKYMKT